MAGAALDWIEIGMHWVWCIIVVVVGGGGVIRDDHGADRVETNQWWPKWGSRFAKIGG